MAYVAEGKNGLIKVGQTQDLDKRLPDLRKSFAAKGDEMVRIAPCKPIRCARVVEYLVIQHCREHFSQHSGQEWFTGCTFEEVYALAVKETEANKDIIPPAPLSKEEREEISLRYTTMREASRADRAAWHVDQARRSAAFQLKRRKSERVIAAIVAFVAPQQPAA
jgi:hypothetical protein